MINVHGIRRNVKNVVRNYSEAQIKVREATSNDPWGPSGTLMSEIADLTYNVVAFSEIMQVIWKRLNDHGKNWKHVYKALVLLEYLVKTGSEKVTQQCKENIFAIQTLKDFQYFEENKDQGINVREKAKQLVGLLKDDDRLKSERARALKARERFAQASSRVKNEPIRRHYGSDEFTDRRRSYEDDIISPGVLSLSELENARPQTVGEEELQLQLALAMSKEEADQAERLKRNDDLRLQMALSESKETFEHCRIKELDMKKSSAVDELADVFSSKVNGHSNINAPITDPWGVPVIPRENKVRISNNSQWNDNAVLPEQNSNIVHNDPWSPLSPDSVFNNENNSYFNSQRSSINSLDATSLRNDSSGSFDMTNIKKSLSVSSAMQNSYQGVKSPKKFLGPNANLVNLDSLIETQPTAAGTAVNPFSSPLLGNPFQAARPSPPTINELRSVGEFNAFPASATLPNINNHTAPQAASASSNPSLVLSNNPFI